MDVVSKRTGELYQKSGVEILIKRYLTKWRAKKKKKTDRLSMKILALDFL